MQPPVPMSGVGAGGWVFTVASILAFLAAGVAMQTGAPAAPQIHARARRAVEPVGSLLQSLAGDRSARFPTSNLPMRSPDVGAWSSCWRRGRAPPRVQHVAWSTVCKRGLRCWASESINRRACPPARHSPSVRLDELTTAALQRLHLAQRVPRICLASRRGRRQERARVVVLRPTPRTPPSGGLLDSIFLADNIAIAGVPRHAPTLRSSSTPIAVLSALGRDHRAHRADRHGFDDLQRAV